MWNMLVKLKLEVDFYFTQHNFYLNEKHLNLVLVFFLITLRLFESELMMPAQ